MLFSGTYEHNIDAKNRLAIPSPVREELERGGDGKKLYVAPGMLDKTLAIWPEKHFLAMTNQMPQSPIPDPDQLAFEGIFFSSTHGVEPDGQGRILVPEALMKEIGIGRQVMITGMRDHLAIWNRDDFARFKEENKARFALLQQRAREAIRKNLEHGRTQS
jgi:MraZ protein